VAGARFARAGTSFYNPDHDAAALRDRYPDMSAGRANLTAWQIGLAHLRHAITTREDWAFETTLGGQTMTDTIAQATKSHDVHVIYVGLATVEDNIARVRQRVRLGGHDIPDDAIRRRFHDAPRNLIHLIPSLYGLDRHDNTAPALDATWRGPTHLLSVRNGRVNLLAAQATRPAWAAAIIEAALAHWGAPPR